MKISVFIPRFLRMLFPSFLLLVTAQSEAEIWVDGVAVDSLQDAFSQAKDNSYIILKRGDYNMAGRLTRNGVTITAEPGVRIHGVAYAGKAALVIAGNDTKVENIECFGIEVTDLNGACIRLSGQNLRLQNVYFHDSQQGLLAGAMSGKIDILNSRFERLGYGGKAHGIYVAGGELNIYHSKFLAAKGAGHAIKSRARITNIQHSIVASIDGKNSRLVDVPNGGVLTIMHSVLQQGSKADNRDLIGFGLEGVKHPHNVIDIRNNLIISDRARSRLLNIRGVEVEPSVRANRIVGNFIGPTFPQNDYFATRSDANIAPEPYVPDANGSEQPNNSAAHEKRN